VAFTAEVFAAALDADLLPLDSLKTPSVTEVISVYFAVCYLRPSPQMQLSESPPVCNGKNLMVQYALFCSKIFLSILNSFSSSAEENSYKFAVKLADEREEALYSLIITNQAMQMHERAQSKICTLHLFNYVSSRHFIGVLT
jgi:hypothetical protein